MLMRRRNLVASLVATMATIASICLLEWKRPEVAETLIFSVSRFNSRLQRRFLALTTLVKHLHRPVIVVE
jgi:hypothetical protein